MNKKKTDAIFSDEELLLAAKNGDNIAFSTLYKKYTNSALKIAYCRLSSLYGGMAILEDYKSEIDLVFLRVYQSHNENSGSFKSYFNTCINNSISRYLERNVYNGDLLRASISLDTTNDGENLYDFIADPKEADPSILYRLKDIELEICSPLKGKHTNAEILSKNIAMLKHFGYTNKEISSITKTPINKVSRINVENKKAKKV